MKARQASWFVREVRKRHAAEPGKPIRFDVALGDELAACSRAHATLIQNPGGKLIPWALSKREHPANKALVRVAFLGPEMPRPVRIVRGPRLSKGATPQSVNADSEKKLTALCKQYGPAYHIRMRPAVGMKRQDNGWDFEVWRGEDWAVVGTAALYTSEIPGALNQSQSRQAAIQYLSPLADRFRAIVRSNRQNAGIDKGGRGYIQYGDLVALLKKHKAEGLSYSEAEIAIARDELPRNYSHYKIRARISRREKMPAVDYYATL